MSRAAKLTLLTTSVVTAGIVLSVHYGQQAEKAAMHEGVIQDMERQRIKKERQADFDMQRALEEQYKQVQTVSDARVAQANAFTSDPGPDATQLAQLAHDTPSATLVQSLIHYPITTIDSAQVAPIYLSSTRFSTRAADGIRPVKMDPVRSEQRGDHEHSSAPVIPSTSVASAALESLLAHSTSVVPHAPAAAEFACCCGRYECAYLKHNNAALDGLERNVRTAAQLGQALLVRHEAYMIDAEQERRQMNATIEQLEAEKRDMEVANAKTVEENRKLLDQLEDLNNSVADSDVHIKSLTSTLEETQQELQRLATLASRTARLETQLLELEQERADLQRSLTASEEEERSAMQRWREAERTLATLQEQMEHIETEAYDERVRHVELLARLERKQAVEKELENAAGRLKGAAATVGKGRDGSNVVSHFVKDILQDNGNLQMGIVELRQMLSNSNEEVQQLREQLILHQPVAVTQPTDPQPVSLKDELAAESPRSLSQELHVHHHYYATERAKERTSTRRSKKKRNITSPGLFMPPSDGQGPQTPHGLDGQPRLLSQTTISTPIVSHPGEPPRWSMQSNHTLSSVPSSPQSVSRHASIFDRSYADNPLDSSRPTSPESSDASSPLFVPHHTSRDSDASFRSFAAPAPLQLQTPTPAALASTLAPPTEEEKDGEDDELPDLDTTQPTIPEESEDSTLNTPDAELYRPVTSLRRSASHESLVSVSGMDIHTLRERPSQLSFLGNGFSGHTPRSVSSPQSTTFASSKPVLSATTATARPLLAGRRYDSRTYNQSLLHGAPLGLDAYPPSSAALIDTVDSFGKRVGGWVWSR
ncbi:MAG: hypothetical protein M1838_005330, partial [Thelocarpon superellum]